MAGTFGKTKKQKLCLKTRKVSELRPNYQTTFDGSGDSTAPASVVVDLTEDDEDWPSDNGLSSCDEEEIVSPELKALRLELCNLSRSYYCRGSQVPDRMKPFTSFLSNKRDTGREETTKASTLPAQTRQTITVAGCTIPWTPFPKPCTYCVRRKRTSAKCTSQIGEKPSCTKSSTCSNDPIDQPVIAARASTSGKRPVLTAHGAQLDKRTSSMTLATFNVPRSDHRRKNLVQHDTQNSPVNNKSKLGACDTLASSRSGDGRTGRKSATLPDKTPHSSSSVAPISDLLESCPLCQIVFSNSMSQVDKDGHIALCYSASADDLTW